MTVDTASSIGSGLIGATIGQSLIPIPFLGAFVGGFIGGFIGELGGKALINKL
jgi:phage tail tape-measure protein